MRIGIDARNVTSSTSGLVTVVQNLVATVGKDAQHELVIFCQEQGVEIFKQAGLKAQVVRVPFRNKFLSSWNYLYERLWYGRVVNRYWLDVFHNPVGFGMPRGVRARVILTVHDLIPLYSDDALSTLQRAIYRRSWRNALRETDQVVTISEFTAREVRKYDPNIASVTTIHDGFDRMSGFPDLEGLYNRLRRELGIPEPYIVYVGSGTKRKNLPNLIRAFTLLKKECRLRHRLVIVSKFNRPATLRTKHEVELLLEEHQLTDQVRFIGYLSDANKAAVMEHAEVFVYPSRYEGFGLPILEAMSVDTAVACSAIPAHHEVAGEAAAFFDPEDPADIARVLHQIVTDDRLRETLVRAGQKRTNLFSWEKMAQEYLTLYEELGHKQ